MQVRNLKELGDPLGTFWYAREPRCFPVGNTVHCTVPELKARGPVATHRKLVHRDNLKG